MPLSLATYSSDRRMTLSKAESIRSPSFQQNWNAIRIGLRGTFVNAAATISGTPVLALGVCNGIAGYGGVATHVVGLRTNAASLSFNAGTPNLLTPGQINTIQAFKKVAGVATGAALTSTGNSAALSASTGTRLAWIVEITKGSPNYSFLLGCPTSSGIGDVSDTEFTAMMELGAGMSGLSTVKTGYQVSAATTLAVSEVDGVLNNLFVYWDRTTSQFSFDIKAARLS